MEFPIGLNVCNGDISFPLTSKVGMKIRLIPKLVEISLVILLIFQVRQTELNTNRRK